MSSNEVCVGHVLMHSFLFFLFHITAGGAKPWVRRGVKSCGRRQWMGFKPRYKLPHHTHRHTNKGTHTHTHTSVEPQLRRTHKISSSTKKGIQPLQRLGERVHVCALVPVTQKRDSCCALQIWQGYATRISHG